MAAADAMCVIVALSAAVTVLSDSSAVRRRSVCPSRTSRNVIHAVALSFKHYAASTQLHSRF
eukprot:7270036-Heterocapsa_arctica.AAC.1